MMLCALSFISVHAHSTQSLTQRMLKPVIAMKCDQELSTLTLWKGAAFFMSEQQKSENKKAICECVSDHAMDNMSAKDLIKAAVSEAEKDRLLNQAIKNSLRGCAKKVFE